MAKSIYICILFLFSLSQAGYSAEAEVPLTQALAEQNGLKLATPEENRDFLTHVEGLRLVATQLCCGDQEACRQPMQEVKFSICKVPADKHAKDDCLYGAPGYFRKDEDFYLFANLLKQIQGNKGEYSREERATAKLQEGTLQKALRRLPYREAIFPGEIIVSPYLYPVQNTTQLRRPVSDKALIHEFTHACSSIWLQLKTFSKPARPAVDTLLQGWDGYSVRRDSGARDCKIRPETISAYSAMMGNLDGGRAILDCIADLAKSSVNPRAAEYVKGSCPVQKLEEGLAEAFGLYGSLVKYGRIEKRSLYCDQGPDESHPSTHLVLQCLRDHSRFFKDAIGPNTCSS